MEGDDYFEKDSRHTRSKMVDTKKRHNVKEENERLYRI
jgi:hypothetical protein